MMRASLAHWLLWVVPFGGGTDHGPNASASLQLQPFWDRAGILFVAEYHSDCSLAANLQAQLPELSPAPQRLFMEFFELRPPVARADLEQQYFKLSGGYPCQAQHAELVMKARSLGVEVVGLYNSNITKSHLGLLGYIRARAEGSYDEYVRSVVAANTPARDVGAGPATMVMFLGSDHYANQHHLYSLCENSRELVGVRQNTTATTCADHLQNLENCTLVGDNEFKLLTDHHFHCQQGSTARAHQMKYGPWSFGCLAYRSACPGKECELYFCATWVEQTWVPGDVGESGSNNPIFVSAVCLFTLLAGAVALGVRVRRCTQDDKGPLVEKRGRRHACSWWDHGQCCELARL
mmetsp:Transcript_6485/g.19223  ORF Transcript_6485/g.19223 Transcript_6485/m.19223 type:complete len:350 (-) Transcript_6485:201-1250(-)